MIQSARPTTQTGPAAVQSVDDAEATTRTAAPVLRLEGVSRSFGGLMAVARGRPRRPRGRDPGLDRAERGRQDHAVQPDHRRLPAQRRPDPLPGRRHHAAVAAEALQARHRADLSARAPVPDLSVLDNVAVGRVYGREPAARARRPRPRRWRSWRGWAWPTARDLLARTLTLRGPQAPGASARPGHPSDACCCIDELLAGLNPSEVLVAMDLIGEIRASGVDDRHGRASGQGRLRPLGPRRRAERRREDRRRDARPRSPPTSA